MENKYYTPSIKEFHVGFEYEYLPRRWNWLLESSGKDWIKESFTGSCGQDGETELGEIENSIEENKCRVKHLDREDIESLGWAFIEWKGVKPVAHYQNKNGVDLWVEDESVVSIATHHQIFKGTIKNKSELKKVLKMIGV